MFMHSVNKLIVGVCACVHKLNHANALHVWDHFTSSSCIYSCALTCVCMCVCVCLCLSEHLLPVFLCQCLYRSLSVCACVFMFVGLSVWMDVSAGMAQQHHRWVRQGWARFDTAERVEAGAGGENAELNVALKRQSSVIFLFLCAFER